LGKGLNPDGEKLRQFLAAFPQAVNHDPCGVPEKQKGSSTK